MGNNPKLENEQIGISYYHSLTSRLLQQSTKCDGRCENRKVHEKERRQTLCVEGVREVRFVMWQFSFDVGDETAEKSAKNFHLFLT